MLPLQQTIQFSDYIDLYDLIIPQDNLLRRINDLVDFSFIQKYCCPIKLFERMKN